MKYVWVIQGAPEALKVFKTCKSAELYLKKINYKQRSKGIWQHKDNHKNDIDEFDMYISKEYINT